MYVTLRKKIKAKGNSDLNLAKKIIEIIMIIFDFLLVVLILFLFRLHFL